MDARSRRFLQVRLHPPIASYLATLWDFYDLLFLLWRNIPRYHPDEGLVMTWINVHLEYKFRDAIADYLQEQDRINNQISLDAPLKNPNFGDESNNILGEIIPQPEPETYQSNLVCECIEKNPRGDI